MTSLLLPLVLSSAYSGHRPTALGDPYRHLADYHYPLRASQANHLLVSPVVYGEDLHDVHNLDNLRSLRSDFFDYLHRPWATGLVQSSGASCVSLDHDTYKVTVNLEKYEPAEVEVKLSGGYLVIRAKHEEKNEEGGVKAASSLLRKYWLPKNVEREKLVASLSSDGVLTVQAPLTKVDENKPEDKKPEETSEVAEASSSSSVESEEEEEEAEKEIEVVLTGKPAAEAEEKVAEEEEVKKEEEEVKDEVVAAGDVETNEVEKNDLTAVESVAGGAPLENADDDDEAVAKKD